MVVEKFCERVAKVCKSRGVEEAPRPPPRGMEWRPGHSSQTLLARPAIGALTRQDERFATAPLPRDNAPQYQGSLLQPQGCWRIAIATTPSPLTLETSASPLVSIAGRVGLPKSAGRWEPRITRTWSHCRG